MKANRKVLVRKSQRGNDLMIWKEWALAGLEATCVAPSMGMEGSQLEGATGKGRAFLWHQA